MKKPLFVAFALGVTIFISGFTFAQPTFSVCETEAKKARAQIEADYAQWVNAVKDMPTGIRDAYMVELGKLRDQAYRTTDEGRDKCAQGFIKPQEVVDFAVGIYTGGLSLLFPKKVFNIDVSELMTGKPLGGPNAAIPKVRDQLLKVIGLGGSSNTLGNIIRDPIRCITFQRKC